MKTTGYQLCDLLRKTAEETANPERAQIMLWAADEVERLINEVRILEKEKSRLEGEISEMESISLANSFIIPLAYRMRLICGSVFRGL